MLRRMVYAVSSLVERRFAGKARCFAVKRFGNIFVRIPMKPLRTGESEGPESAERSICRCAGISCRGVVRV